MKSLSIGAAKVHLRYGLQEVRSALEIADSDACVRECVQCVLQNMAEARLRLASAEVPITQRGTREFCLGSEMSCACMPGD